MLCEHTSSRGITIMSIEHQGPVQIRNANGEEVRPATLTSGEVRYITDGEFRSLVERGEISIPHSGETVYKEFDNTPLPDAFNNGLIITPDTPAALVGLEKKTNTKKIMASIAGLGLAAGAAVFGYSQMGDGKEIKPRIEAPTSTPSSLNTESPTPSQSPENINPSIDQYIDDLNRDPSNEAIAYSLQPVAVGEFSSREAAVRLMNDWKIYWLSGETSQSGDISQTETPESLATGTRQLDNIFGPEGVRDEDKLLWEWMTGTREYLTLNMGYLITENGYPEDGVLNNTFDIMSMKDLGNGEVEFLVRNEWSSNMGELDPSVATQDIDAIEFSTDRYITVGQHDGNYHITQIQSRAVVD